MHFFTRSFHQIKAAPLYAFIFFIFTSCAPAPEQTIQGKTMGTTYQIKLANSAIPQAVLKRDIDALLDTINMKMSTYIAESEISQFNSSESTDWQTLSQETITVLEKSVEVHKNSAGAFDITVGPLVNLWGFGPDKRPSKVPSQSSIDSTMNASGSNFLEIDTADKRVRKLKSGVKIDLSAIAKGYGVDQVAQFLNNRGVQNFLVEIGGEIKAQGHKSNGQPWHVAIERAENSAQQAQQLLSLSNLALATSGSYRNYFEEDGVRYSHTIDPTTGRPITHTLVSVSVLANDCMTADAWATALMVLGPNRGFSIAEKNNIVALFIEKNSSTFSEKKSSKWNSLLP